MTGINTRAPDNKMVTMSGPSMRGEEVSTRKQRAAQQRVSTMHWDWVSGFFITGFYRIKK